MEERREGGGTVKSDEDEGQGERGGEVKEDGVIRRRGRPYGSSLLLFTICVTCQGGLVCRLVGFMFGIARLGGFLPPVHMHVYV